MTGQTARNEPGMNPECSENASFDGSLPMPIRRSICPHCQERLPEAEPTAAVENCPRCGEPVAGREIGGMSAMGLKASRTRRALPMSLVAIVCLAVIAGAG